MLDERAQQRLIAGDRTRRLFRAFEELGQLAGREVGQRVHLGVAPDQLANEAPFTIELGGVAREAVDLQPRVPAEEPLHVVTTMDFAAVPEEPDAVHAAAEDRTVRWWLIT